MVVTKSEEIELRCKACNHKLCDYEIQNDDTAYVLSNISVKCGRCRRAIVFKKYTEAMVRRGAVAKGGRMVKSL